MNQLHDDRTALEEGTTAMLRRLAADARVNPPLWDDLLARRDGVVVRLAVDDRIGERPVAPAARWHRPGAGLAAAAVIGLAVAGALVVDRSPDSGSPATEPITIVTPGDASFDAETAAAVWATGAGDPLSAAAAYLHTLGIPAGSTAAAVSGGADEAASAGTGTGTASLAVRSDDGATAVVDWALDGASGTSGGTVYLRSSALPVVVGDNGGGTGGVDTPDVGGRGWVVVGSSAADVALDEVSYDGEQLSFQVARTAAADDQLAITVWVDGRPVSLGGDAVLDAAGRESLGELVEIGGEAGSAAALGLPIEPDDVVTMRVVHVVEGRVRSVTQLALALPEAAPELAAGIAGAVEAAGSGTQPGGGAIAGEGSGSGSTGSDSDEGGGEAEGSVSGSAEDGGMPGVPVPTLPPLPVPRVPGAPPAPLPVPTTTPPAPDLVP
jgi:hypothetical protein